MRPALPVEQLGCGVGQRAGEGAAGRAAPVCECGDPEISEPDDATSVDEAVVGFHISVHDLGSVCVGQGISELDPGVDRVER